MFKLLYPYEYIDSVFSIDYGKLFSMGYRGLIFDIDNTLVHHGDNSTAEIDKLFRTIQDLGFKTLLLSNNDEERVIRFLKNINSLYICDAQKPSPVNYLKAVEMMNISREQALFIGDQLFTDIWLAKRFKYKSILVQRLNRQDYGLTKLFRGIEKMLLEKKNDK